MDEVVFVVVVDVVSAVLLVAVVSVVVADVHKVFCLVTQSIRT